MSFNALCEQVRHPSNQPFYLTPACCLPCPVSCCCRVLFLRRRLFVLDACPFAAPLVQSSPPGALFISSWVLLFIANLFVRTTSGRCFRGPTVFSAAGYGLRTIPHVSRIRCPLSLSLIASRSHLSETSRLTNEGTAWPRQVPSVSLTRAACQTAA